MPTKNKKSKLVAPLLATMLVVPFLTPDDALAQQRRGDRGGNGDGQGRDRNGNGNGGGVSGGFTNNTGTNNSGGFTTTNTVQRDRNRDWVNEYIGKPRFKLIDDAKLQKMARNANILEDSLTELTKVVVDKEKALKTLTDSQKAKQQEIKKLQDETVTAVAKKAELEKNIQQIKGTLPSLETKVSLAQAAVDSTGQSFAEATAKHASAVEALGKLTEQCTAAPTPECQAKVEQAKKRVEQLAKAKAEKEQLAKAAVQDLRQKKKALGEAKKKIADAQTEIGNIDTANSQRAQQIANKKQELQTLNGKVAAAAAELAPMKERHIKLQNQLNQAIIGMNAYRRDLIRDILGTNKDGAERGRYHGRTDGLGLARNLGSSYGQDDGLRDGDIDGIRNGKERDYNNGYAEGLRLGEVRAQQEGERDGTRDGRIAGNTDAGDREGNAAGIDRALQSDAASVGQRQGEEAGMDRAVSTGRRDGTVKGEAQAISKFETRGLENKTVNGPFAGTFERVIPRFPADHVGPSYKPRARGLVGLIKEAYLDGYSTGYGRMQRRAFENNIATIYNSAYDRSYDDAYDVAYRGFYREQFDAGQRNGDQFAFDRDYRGVRDSFFAQTRGQFSQNPDRSSGEYRTTFERVERESFKIKYEQIRRDNFDRFEAETFNANITSQTEKYRLLRFNEVTAIYSNNPVLDFSSSSMKDAGINGIAAADGIFQPGEATVHDVVVKNYGKKAANNVTVTLSDGQKMKLPSIPASATVTVKGAIKGSIANSRAGSVDSKTLRVYSPLTAEAKIQGRHYANPSQGMVNNGDQKRVKIQYPLSLSRLVTNGTPVINEPIQLLVDLANKSSRKYTGPLKIEVSVNSNGNIITKTFNDVQSLESTLRLKDAQVKVSSESDVYTPLTFTAKISKNGVLLGTLDRAFNVMAKAPYTDKPGKPVVVANSEDTRVELLDTLEQLGGIQGAAVLDLSLTGRNGQVLKQGLKDKTVLVIDRGNGNVIKNFDGVVAKSQNNVFIYVDQNKKGLEIAQTTASFKDAGKFSPTIVGVGTGKLVTTNPYRNKNLKGSQYGLQADLGNMRKLLPVAALLKASAGDLIKALSTQINRGTYFNPSRQTLQTAQVFHIKGLAEIVNLNFTYKESGSWLGGRDRKWEKMIYKDTSLPHNALKEVIKKTKLNESSVGLYLLGVNADYTLNKASNSFDDIDDDLTPRTSSAMRKSGDQIEKEVKKDLKKFDKNLYNKVYDNQGIFTPFTPGSDTEGLEEWDR